MRRPSRQPAPRRLIPRLVALGAVMATIGAFAASAAFVSGAQGGAPRTAAEQQRIGERAVLRRALHKAERRAPRARGTRCPDTTNVPGQGPSCRTADGLWVVPQRDGTPLVTHGPDFAAATSRAAHADGFGTPDAVMCSPASRTRHVALLYLLPSDFATTSEAVHGDRYAEVADQLRQAMYDASAVVDRRAGELAGQRRRIRVLCDDDGRPAVERVVLPRTSSQYLAAGSGFGMLGDDLEALGLLPSYEGFSRLRLPSVRRVLAYYDADFHPGYAGQGTMFRRSTLIRSGMRASDPLVSRTARNINNNPPGASLAVQYGTSDYAGTPDPPLYTNLLHELAHTMGAVQDEPPTSSDAGHCVDGLDLMCYADSPDSRYAATACPDPQPPHEAHDELFDCNGDTYFHPAPPAGNPLAASSTWHLGLPANETFAAATTARPRSVGRVTVRGTGTRRTLRWPAVAGAVGYEVAFRRGGRSWEYLWTSLPTAQPMLWPNSRHDLRVAAVGRGLVLGAPSKAAVTTGADNSPPTAPTSVRVQSASRTSARLRFAHARDNVRVTRYRVERREGRRWVSHVLLPAPSARVAAPGDVVLSPAIQRLRPGTHHLLRLRALDGRGNASAPSAAVRVVTRR